MPRRERIPPHGSRETLPENDEKRFDMLAKDIAVEIEAVDPDSRVGRTPANYLSLADRAAILSSQAYATLSEDDRTAFANWIKTKYRFSLDNDSEDADTPDKESKPSPEQLKNTIKALLVSLEQKSGLHFDPKSVETTLQTAENTEGELRKLEQYYDQLNRASIDVDVLFGTETSIILAFQEYKIPTQGGKAKKGKARYDLERLRLADLDFTEEDVNTLNDAYEENNRKLGTWMRSFPKLDETKKKIRNQLNLRAEESGLTRSQVLIAKSILRAKNEDPKSFPVELLQDEEYKKVEAAIKFLADNGVHAFLFGEEEQPSEDELFQKALDTYNVATKELRRIFGSNDGETVLARLGLTTEFNQWKELHGKLRLSGGRLDSSYPKENRVVLEQLTELIRHAIPHEAATPKKPKAPAIATGADSPPPLSREGGNREPDGTPPDHSERSEAQAALEVARNEAVNSRAVYARMLAQERKLNGLWERFTTGKERKQQILDDLETARRDYQEKTKNLVECYTHERGLLAQAVFAQKQENRTVIENIRGFAEYFTGWWKEQSTLKKVSVGVLIGALGAGGVAIGGAVGGALGTLAVGAGWTLKGLGFSRNTLAIGDSAKAATMDILLKNNALKKLNTLTADNVKTMSEHELAEKLSTYYYFAEGGLNLDGEKAPAGYKALKAEYDHRESVLKQAGYAGTDAPTTPVQEGNTDSATSQQTPESKLHKTKRLGLTMAEKAELIEKRGLRVQNFLNRQSLKAEEELRDRLETTQNKARFAGFVAGTIGAGALSWGTYELVGWIKGEYFPNSTHNAADGRVAQAPPNAPPQFSPWTSEIEGHKSEALVHKGEGVTHALVRQLKAMNPEELKNLRFTGNANNHNDLVKFAAKLAREQGYIDYDHNRQVWVMPTNGDQHYYALDDRGHIHHIAENAQGKPLTGAFDVSGRGLPSEGESWHSIETAGERWGIPKPTTIEAAPTTATEINPVTDMKLGLEWFGADKVELDNNLSGSFVSGFEGKPVTYGVNSGYINSVNGKYLSHVHKLEDLFKDAQKVELLNRETKDALLQATEAPRPWNEIAPEASDSEQLTPSGEAESTAASGIESMGAPVKVDYTPTTDDLGFKPIKRLSVSGNIVLEGGKILNSIIDGNLRAQGEVSDMAKALGYTEDYLQKSMQNVTTAPSDNPEMYRTMLNNEITRLFKLQAAFKSAPDGSVLKEAINKAIDAKVNVLEKRWGLKL